MPPVQLRGCSFAPCNTHRAVHCHALRGRPQTSGTGAVNAAAQATSCGSVHHHIRAGTGSRPENTITCGSQHLLHNLCCNRCGCAFAGFDPQRWSEATCRTVTAGAPWSTGPKRSRPRTRRCTSIAARGRTRRWCRSAPRRRSPRCSAPVRAPLQHNLAGGRAPALAPRPMLADELALSCRLARLRAVLCPPQMPRPGVSKTSPFVKGSNAAEIRAAVACGHGGPLCCAPRTRECKRLAAWIYCIATRCQHPCGPQTSSTSVAACMRKRCDDLRERRSAGLLGSAHWGGRRGGGFLLVIRGSDERRA